MDYNLIRSNRRTMSLEVTREGTVAVRAPLHVSGADVQRFVDSRQDWLREKLALQQARRDAHPEPTEVQRAALIERAITELPECVSNYAGIMGLAPSGITITGARTRFGSCSGKNRLCFSWRLMQYPQEAIDYVVVHELAHIVHKNHGKDFYALVESVLPDWKARKALLRE